MRAGRIMCVCVLLASLALVLAGCVAPAKKDDGRLQVLCTTFASFDWARNVVGDASDAVEVSLLLDDGVDLHSYQPSVADIARVSDADLFVYVGGESDEWVADALSAARNEDVRSLALLDTVEGTALTEEIVEGMQGAEGHDHAHGHDHDHEDADEGPHEHEGHEEGEDEEFDEHVWLSLPRAELIVRALADEISALDAAHADEYEKNAAAYVSELAALDARYREVVEASSRDVVVFLDRMPFRYLLDDYGITYFAAFLGCSAETEASFETIVFLANKVSELDLDVALVPEDSDERLATTVIAASGKEDTEIMHMDSLQSTTASEIEAGATYLGAMEHNLSVLTRALA